MRIEEAKRIGQIIHSLDIGSCINLGSGNVGHLLASKPWVNHHLFLPLAEREVPVVHADLYEYPCVDYKIDLTQPTDFQVLDRQPGPRLFILGNVLEHIPTQKRLHIMKNLTSYMVRGDHLIVSVPQSYPYHADPIDTGYRPEPPQLMELAHLRWISGDTVICGNFRKELSDMHRFKALRKLCKPLWPFQSFTKYRENWERLSFLFRDYKVAVVHGVKP